MKTLYLTDSSANIVVDADDDYVSTLPCEDRYSIRNVYYIEEPMRIVYDSSECHEEVGAKRGDILLLFYNDRFNKHHIEIVKSKRWSANIKNRHEITQKENEEWAAKNLSVIEPKCECVCDAVVDVLPKKESTTNKTKKSKKA